VVALLSGPFARRQWAAARKRRKRETAPVLVLARHLPLATRHYSSDGETGVAGDVAANEGGQHPGLDFEHPAVGHAITEDRVSHLG